MAKRFLLKDMIFKKKEATVIENMLVAMVSLIMVCGFLVIIFGAFAGISDKWSMRQAARELSADHGDRRVFETGGCGRSCGRIKQLRSYECIPVRHYDE